MTSGKGHQPDGACPRAEELLNVQAGQIPDAEATSESLQPTNRLLTPTTAQIAFTLPPSSYVSCPLPG